MGFEEGKIADPFLLILLLKLKERLYEGLWWTPE
jgi:hypothetical protein